MYPRLNLQTTIGKQLISTKFIGMDSDNWIFETMIFPDDDIEYQVRTNSVSDAEAAHVNAIAHVNKLK